MSAWCKKRLRKGVIAGLLMCLTTMLLAAPPGSIAQQSDQPLRGVVSLQNKPWGVEFTLPGFKVDRVETYAAEMGNKEQAIANLKKAYEYEKNVIPGEGGIPDPSKDDSFKKLMMDKEFREVVDSLRKTSAAAVAAAAAPAKRAAQQQPEAPVQLVSGVVKSGDGNSSVSGTLRDKSGPIADAEIILQSMRDDDCVKAFRNKAPSEKDVKLLQSCLKDLPPVRPDAEGRFEFKDVHPGIYNLRFLWNINPKPKKAPTVYQQGLFVVMYAGRKDESGRYDALAQSEPFRFRKKESFIIHFLDE